MEWKREGRGVGPWRGGREGMSCFMLSDCRHGHGSCHPCAHGGGRGRVEGQRREPLCGTQELLASQVLGSCPGLGLWGLEGQGGREGVLLRMPLSL